MLIPHKKAFTLIELLFVIVILGIVGGLALEAIRHYYEGIYRTKVVSQRITEADHILDQLTKYFENAIDISIVNMDKDAADGALAGNGCSDPGEDNTSSDYTVALLDVDADSLRLIGKPGWNEMPQDFTGTFLKANDSNFSGADASIRARYPASNLDNSVIYNDKGIVGSCTDFNWDNSGGNRGYFDINHHEDHNLTLTNNATGVTLSTDRKYLISSGYAFRVLDTGDFVMFSKFRPWKGERYINGEKSILGKNVASFYADFNMTNSFHTRGSVWRLKVCMRGLDANLSTNDIAGAAICRERKVHVRY